MCVCVCGGGGGDQFDPALSKLLGLIFAISKNALTLRAEESDLPLYRQLKKENTKSKKVTEMHTDTIS